jgi:hypothetical protein
VVYDGSQIIRDAGWQGLEEGDVPILGLLAMVVYGFPAATNGPDFFLQGGGGGGNGF